jgi:ribosomal protein S3
LNGAPKRKSRTIIIGEDIPMISLKSKVEYAEEICFTTNGTLSVKIWIAKRKTTGNLCKMVQKS